MVVFASLIEDRPFRTWYDLLLGRHTTIFNDSLGIPAFQCMALLFDVVLFGDTDKVAHGNVRGKRPSLGVEIKDSVIAANGQDIYYRRIVNASRLVFLQRTTQGLCIHGSCGGIGGFCVVLEWF